MCKCEIYFIVESKIYETSVYVILFGPSRLKAPQTILFVKFSTTRPDCMVLSESFLRGENKFDNFSFKIRDGSLCVPSVLIVFTLGVHHLVV